jgi:tetratricopeptide (TPR) repeat protein
VQAEEIVQEAEQLRQQHNAHLAAATAAGKGVADPDAEQLLERAILKFRGVIGKDPLHRGARNGLANSLADLGVYCQRQPVSEKSSKASALFAEAIQLQDGIIRQDPAFSKAYYNRACYRAVAAASERDRELAIADLAQAIQRDEPWRAYARTDPDLLSLHNTTYWNREVVAKTTAAAP